MRRALAVVFLLAATSASACAPRYPYDWPSDYTRTPINLTIHRGGQAHVQFRTAPAARCVEASDPTQPLGFVDSLGDFSIYEVPGPGQLHVSTTWHCVAPGHGSLPDVHVSIAVVPDDVPAPQPSPLARTRHQIDAASAKDSIDVLTATDAELRAHGLDPRPPDPTSHDYALWLNGIVSTLYIGVPTGASRDENGCPTGIIHHGLIEPVVVLIDPGPGELVDASMLRSISLQFSFDGDDWVVLLSGDRRTIALGVPGPGRAIAKRVPMGGDSVAMSYAFAAPALRSGVRYTIEIERRFVRCPTIRDVGSFTMR